jgi:3-oxoacyl-[acyl-carrier-protein] synthase III
MNGLTLLATGSAAGSRIVSNDDFAERIDTEDAWIYARTGIRRRHFCGEGESTATLAAKAARDALRRSGLDPLEIGCCIAATVSADYTAPGIACLLQKELGLREDIPVLDVNAACSGFLYGLETARGFLESRCPEGGYGLVVGCEQLSKLLDMEDRGTCILFGDGAGAAVVKSRRDCLYESVQGARGGREILVPGPGDGSCRITMDGKAVFRFAVEVLPEILRGLLDKSGRTMEDIDWVVCHQANSRIIDHCIRSMKADRTKFYKNMEHYGNTSAASIPLALDEMAKKGLLKAGQTLVLDGFGAGLTWAGVLMQADENFCGGF